MASVTLRGIRKRYDSSIEVIKGVDLDIHDGEFMVFVGPSGCGKSTMMRMVAGLEAISAGELRIGDTLANDVPAPERGVAMVFQSYALYPHMTVAENMGFSLKMAKLPKDQIREQVQRAAEVLQITHLLERTPKALSGGQRQRVAIGRAIVRKPQVFLFDEPLSNLDAGLRVQMRVELTKLHRELGSTMIYVTHDQVEAMTMGDRIAVFNAGRIEQCGTPLELYQRPANVFVAQFLGSPKMNVLPGTTRSVAGGVHVGGTGADFTLPATVGGRRPGRAPGRGHAGGHPARIARSVDPGRHDAGLVGAHRRDRAPRRHRAALRQRGRRRAAGEPEARRRRGRALAGGHGGQAAPSRRRAAPLRRAGCAARRNLTTTRAARPTRAPPAGSAAASRRPEAPRRPAAPRRPSGPSRSAAAASWSGAGAGARQSRPGCRSR